MYGAIFSKTRFRQQLGWSNCRCNFTKAKHEPVRSRISRQILDLILVVESCTPSWFTGLVYNLKESNHFKFSQYSNDINNTRQEKETKTSKCTTWTKVVFLMKEGTCCSRAGEGVTLKIPWPLSRIVLQIPENKTDTKEKTWNRSVYRISFSSSYAVQDTLEDVQTFGGDAPPLVRPRDLDLGRWLRGEADDDHG